MTRHEEEAERLVQAYVIGQHYLRLVDGVTLAERIAWFCGAFPRNLVWGAA